MGSSVGWLARRLAAVLQQHLEPAGVRLELWDGASTYAGPRPIGTLVVADLRTLLGILVNPHLQFGECYMHGTLQVRGGLEPVLEAITRLALIPSWRERISSYFATGNSVQRARRNVHHHYDLGNDFYSSWLDERLVYTCAYFERPDMSLEQAQIAKMDLVCRKLGLQEGERVVEAGCGWGSLALFMARQYGVSVRAFNISHEQIAFARRRAKEEGLAGRVTFVEDDYRNIRGAYEAFVSIGMLEHVGAADYPTLGRVIDRSLTPGGRGLLHFIGRNQPLPLNPWIRRRIFPGAYPPTLREVFGRVFEPNALSVLDVENLRLHYAKTLEHWRRRFDRASEDVAHMFDATFVRTWELYLAGSQAAFDTGSMQLFQVLFARGSSNAIPWTRVSG